MIFYVIFYGTDSIMRKLKDIIIYETSFEWQLLSLGKFYSIHNSRLKKREPNIDRKYEIENMK